MASTTKHLVGYVTKCITLIRPPSTMPLHCSPELELPLQCETPFLRLVWRFSRV